MRDVQPPITNDEEYQGYKLGLEKMTAWVAEREQRLIAALAGQDDKLLEARRTELLRALRRRQGIIDAIKEYERRQQQSA